MTLFKMAKEVVTTKEVELICSECRLKFKYPKNDSYYPKTCGYDCEFKRQHPELYKERR